MSRLANSLLAHPKTRGLDLDAPETTELRREIILSKPFLRSIYVDWYRRIASAIPDGDGRVIEIGAGGGFFDTEVAGALTSEIFYVPGIDLVADAQSLPLEEGSLKSIVMTNVFHHLPDVPAFLTEAQGAIRAGGRIIMIEPWNTTWSKFVHEKFHSELMSNNAEQWEFPTAGPLSGANAALAWIVVNRDKSRLESEWKFRVVSAEPFMPFSYIASGGVSLRSLQPGWMYPAWRWLDSRDLFKTRMAIFSFIVLERLA